jgi:ribonuclease D
VQLTVGETIYLIDTVALRDISALGTPLATMEWVLHAGRQDIALLMSACRLTHRPRLFDTQIAWGLCSAEHQVSLAYLLACLLGVRTEKGCQTDNWQARPLPEGQLVYAAEDVAYLPELYETLQKRLEAVDRFDIVPRVCEEVLNPPPAPTTKVSLGQFRNLWQLTGKQKAALVALIDWYNDLDSQGRRSAPHRKVLLSIASRLPENGRILCQIKGVPRRLSMERANALVDLMQRAAADAVDDPGNAPPTPYGSFDDLFRDAWLHCARAEVCAAACISPELAFPQWLVKHLRAAIGNESEYGSAAVCFVGWRACLAPAWTAFCEATRP